MFSSRAFLLSILILSLLGSYWAYNKAKSFDRIKLESNGVLLWYTIEEYEEQWVEPYGEVWAEVAGLAEKKEKRKTFQVLSGVLLLVSIVCLVRIIIISYPTQRYKLKR